MDALRSVLPAGTLSGAPKVRAMQIIDELEPVKRGGYGGAIGWLSYARRPRHLHLHPHRRGQGRRRPRAGRRRHGRRRQARLRVRGVAWPRPAACCEAIELAVRAARTGPDARPRHRQLRLLHLQPRPVPGRARGRGRGRPQRPGRPATGCSSGATTAPSSRPARARPTRPASAWPSSGASPRPACRRSACASATRRWPRPSAATSCATSRCTARRPRSSTTAARSSPGCPSPLTVGRYHSLVVDPDAARRPRADRQRRRRADGRAPPRPAGRGRPVPPRVGAHPRRQAAAGELPCPTRRSPRRSTRWPRAAT